MEEIPGLAHIRANNEVVKEFEDDVEFEITVYAHQQDSELCRLSQMGWIIRAPNVFAWLKPTYYTEGEEDPPASG